MPTYIPTTWIAKVSEFTAAAMNKLEQAVKQLADNSIEKSATQPSNPTVGMVWVQSGVAADTSAPSAPVQAVLSATSTSVTVSWAASTDNVSVQGYDVWRLISATWTKVNPTLVTGLTFTEEGLASNTSYGPYLVRARDFAGNVSGDSNQRGPITTALAGDTQGPTVPTGLQATTGNGQISLTCNPSTDNVGVVGYKWWTNAANPQTTVGPTATTKVITGLTNGVLYNFSVSAYDAVPNESARSASVPGTPSAGGDTTNPSAPGTLTATPGNGQANLSWVAATDNVSVDHYELFQDGVYQVDVPGTSYIVAGLSNGTLYRFKVRAVDAVGNTGAFNTEVPVTPNGSSGVTYTDDFNRADVVVSTVGSTALGGGWTLGSGSAAIASNQFKVQTNATVGLVINTNLPTTNDQFIECVYGGGAAAAAEFHQTLRTDSTAANWLGCRWIPLTSGGASAFILERMVAGTLSNLVTVTLPALMTAGDLMRFEVDGPNLAAKLNGVLVSPAASTASVPTGPAVGFRWKTAINIVVDSERHGDL